MRNRFDEELENFHLLQVKMGAVCEDMLKNLDNILKLEKSTSDLSQSENEVMRLSRETENMTLDLMIRRQPVAKDLRDISSAFKIAYDFRRIAIQSIDIKEIYDKLSDNEIANDENLLKMSSLVMTQLKYSINAIIKRDKKLCIKISDLDDDVDKLFTKIKLDSIEKMKYNIEISEDIVNILMIAKYYEKIGDHCVNIANNIYFSVTGEKKTVL